MCMCEKPNINGNYGFCWNDRNEIGTHGPFPPTTQEGDEVLFDEPGRCGHGIDSHCLHITVVKRHATNYMLVKTWGGQEEMLLGKRFGVEILKSMDSDSRYWLLQMFYSTIGNEQRRAQQEERVFWRKAIAENRVKKRKVRNENRIDVWVLGESNTTLTRSLG